MSYVPGDYMPISLLVCLYKLVAEVLAARLGAVVNSISDKNQSTFIKGRHLTDGVVAMNEVVDYAKRKGGLCKEKRETMYDC